MPYQPSMGGLPLANQGVPGQAPQYAPNSPYYGGIGAAIPYDPTQAGSGGYPPLSSGLPSSYNMGGFSNAGGYGSLLQNYGGQAPNYQQFVPYSAMPSLNMPDLQNYYNSMPTNVNANVANNVNSYMANFQGDPGYQFQLQQGELAIQQAAAANGGYFSGGTGVALNNYAQGAAANDYNNIFNQQVGLQTNQFNQAQQAYMNQANMGTTEYQAALNQANMGYGAGVNQQQNLLAQQQAAYQAANNQYLTQYNMYNQNQNNLYNRLASMSGIGQTATGQVGQAGQQTSAALGNSLTNIGNAQAQGTLGAANAQYQGLQNIYNIGASGTGMYANYAQNQQLMSILANMNNNNIQGGPG